MATRSRLKAEKLEATKDKRPFAKSTHIRMSSSKVRIVLDNIRGKNALDAVAIMEASKQVAAEPILKVLQSAIANAENNKGLNRDSLIVAECFTTQGPQLKRIMTRAKGSADQILKKTCHITIVLDEAK